MPFRVRHLLNDSIQSSDTATFSLQLPESGNLHSLLIRLTVTNGATSGRDVNPLSIPSLVRVVGDGDYRYFELSPQEIEKYNESIQGHSLDMRVDENASVTQYVVLPIHFGRVPYDPEYFLPLSRVKNPRLEIPYAFTAAADGGFATGTFTVDVVAIWTPDNEPLAYKGTLVKRTIKSFTSAASGDESSEINIKEPIRTLGIYAYEAGVADGANITRVRLEANSGEYDIWAGDWNNLQEFTRSFYWSRIEHNFKCLLQNNDTLHTRISNPVSIQVTPISAVDTTDDSFQRTVPDTEAGDLLTFDSGDVDITAGSETITANTADVGLYVNVEGHSPSYFGLMPFHIPDDPSGYLNPTLYDTLKLILTQGNAGAAVRLSVEYLKQVMVGAQ